MNFQNLQSVEKSKWYLDLAFKRAKKKAEEYQSSKPDRLSRIKDKELIRMDIIYNTLHDRFDIITKGFPSIDHMDPFYTELIKCTLEYSILKKSLGAVNWCDKKINGLFKEYRSKISRSNDIKKITSLRREFYGRVSSFVNQIKDELDMLEESRKVMKGFPAIKTKMFTVCIFGFPNVGKSTLLKKLTGSSPDINSYPFTTKRLNIGYIEHNYRKIQLIDTPGTLNRFQKMNDIEKQAYLAVKHLANLVIFVFDPTEEYPLKDQLKLKRNIKALEKPIIDYVSKTDLVETKIEGFRDIEKLNQELLVLADIDKT